MDESLTDAGFITELTPSDASKVDAYKDHSEKLLATPVTSPPQREYKQATKDAMTKGDFVVTESGFNFTVGFDAEPSVAPVLTPNRVPSFYAHFEIGKPMMFAYHVGGELFESPMFPSKLVSCNIGYKGENQFLVLKFEDGLAEINQRGAFSIFTYGDVKKPLVSVKKPENKDKIQSFIESKKMATLEEFIAFRCCSVDAMEEYAEAIDNASAFKFILKTKDPNNPLVLLIALNAAVIMHTIDESISIESGIDKSISTLFSLPINEMG